MLQSKVLVYRNQVPFCARQNSYGFTSRLKFDIFSTKKPINLFKTLANNLKLLKVGEINIQQYYNDILEVLLNCQNRYGFRSRSQFEIFVKSRNQNLGRSEKRILRMNKKSSKEPNKYCQKEPNKYFQKGFQIALDLVNGCTALYLPTGGLFSLHN